MIAINNLKVGKTIPKVIHQTCPSKLDLPAEIKASIQAMRELNPAWEYRLYDDADIERIILRHYSDEILELYLKINPRYGAARADFFRYLLLYAEGGLYLDVKSTLLRALDDVLLPDDSYILSNWDNHADGSSPGWGLHKDLGSLERGEYQQWFIASASGHPFLKAVVQQVIDNIQRYNVFTDGVGELGVWRTTGPIAYTLAIEEIVAQHPYRQVEAARDLGIKYNIFEAKKHRDAFGKHYSLLKDPVIQANGFIGRCFNGIHQLMVGIGNLEPRCRALIRRRD